MDVPRPALHCPPAFKYLIFSKDGKWMKYLMRGDANGRIALWKIPDTPECAAMQLKKVNKSARATAEICKQKRTRVKITAKIAPNIASKLLTKYLL
jgi:hypothetical protein